MVHRIAFHMFLGTGFGEAFTYWTPVQVGILRHLTWVKGNDIPN